MVKLDYLGFMTMVQKLLFSLLFTFMAATFFISSPAHAQYAGGNTSVDEEEDEEFRISLYPEHTYDVTFFQEPRVSESNFTLRLSYEGTVGGCAHLEDMTKEKDQEKYNFKNGVSTKVVSGTFEVIISQPVLVDSDDNPRYTSYDCEIKHNDSYVDVNINRDFLIKKKIKKIGFKNIKTADFGDFDIDVNKDRFILKTPSPKGELWYTLWFFPKNSIVLLAPKANSNLDVKEQIKDFALARGLVPMENVLEGYRLPHSARNYMFFDDPKGRYANKLSAENNSLDVGSITATKTYYGPNGAQEEEYEIKLYAKLPLVRKIEEN